MSDKTSKSKKSKNDNEMRSLKKHEIEDILSFLEINEHIPKETSESVIKNTKRDLKKQLKTIQIYPSMIGKLKKQIIKNYYDTLVQPGECVGVIVAQSIGEKQTQSNLNTFHRAGSSDKQPVVSTFGELLNATTKPKQPMYTIYFNGGNDNIQNLRKTIGYNLAQLNIKKLSTSISIELDAKREPWYDIFFILNEDKKEQMEENKFVHCLKVKINMELVFEFKITLKEISHILESRYPDILCIYSPDCFAQIDIFVDTRDVSLPEKKLLFVNEDNMNEVYLEEVVQPMMENTIICGIEGITSIFFLNKKGERDEWYIETENSKDKKEKDKDKNSDSKNRFRQVLSLDFVDNTRTVSNNIWDMYSIFGIEAVREYMVEQFSSIMEGINVCHVTLLVDRMTWSGSISSISRYTMRKENTGVFCSASFEETLDNFLRAGMFGQRETTNEVSASVICGKRANMGSGLCKLEMDLGKLMSTNLTPIDEDEESIEE